MESFPLLLSRLLVMRFATLCQGYCVILEHLYHPATQDAIQKRNGFRPAVFNHLNVNRIHCPRRNGLTIGIHSAQTALDNFLTNSNSGFGYVYQLYFNLTRIAINRGEDMKYSKKQILDFYRTMLRIRLFEERIVYMYARGEVPGLAHLSIGQEACAVGTCANLREDDYISSTHRGHGHVIAKGADVKPMMAELFGKIDGYCKGKGGSMHIADMDIGILGANGIVGAGQPIAVGAALSAKLRGTDKVSICFFGDDATNIGSFHESLNLASLMKLPAIFLCENNLYGLSTPQSKHQPITDISIRATSYDMPGVTIDGNDVFAVYEAVYKAVRRARAGEGPTLIEAKTLPLAWTSRRRPQRRRAIPHQRRDGRVEEKMPHSSAEQKDDFRSYCNQASLRKDRKRNHPGN